MLNGSILYLKGFQGSDRDVIHKLLGNGGLIKPKIVL